MKVNTIYHGNCLDVLKNFPSESIDCIVTSPSYYGLRDYGVEGQIGQEKTPQEYISNLMKIMDECKRVLKKTGSLWVNIGDSYGGTGDKKGYRDPKYKEGRNGQDSSSEKNLNPKSLLGIPERFVIAMTDANWIRRNTVIWYKPNAMPSSAKDRFTVDFEYFYFFTKSQKYYFETQYEPLESKPHPPRNKSHINYGNGIQQQSFIRNPKKIWGNTEQGRLKRCVWKINTQSFKGSHFAVFPNALVETPIKACCPPNGVVLDPFAGAGTTCLVAKKLGRNYIGVELNKNYIDIANERIGKV